MAHAANPLNECGFTLQHVEGVVAVAWDRHGDCNGGDGEVGVLVFVGVLEGRISEVGVRYGAILG